MSGIGKVLFVKFEDLPKKVHGEVSPNVLHELCHSDLTHMVWPMLFDILINNLAQLVDKLLKFRPFLELDVVNLEFVLKLIDNLPFKILFLEFVTLFIFFTQMEDRLLNFSSCS